MRKPDSLEMRSRGNVKPDLAFDVGEAQEGGFWVLAQGLYAMSAAECRRLAAWLIRAAEWIENKEGGR